MFEQLSFSDEHTIALEAKGEITKTDYQEIISPLIKKAKDKNTKLNFMVYFGPEFESFTAGAAWEDFKLGVHHFYAFNKIAVVSNKSYIRTFTKVFAPLLPSSVETFTNDELNQAQAWITSSETSLTHELDEEKGVLTLEITAPLSADTFSSVSRVVDPWIEKTGNLNAIVIHTKKFPGWDNLGSIFSHLEFVKSHHKKISKVAFVADGSLAELAPYLSKHFVKAKVKHFAYDELNIAQTWAAS